MLKEFFEITKHELRGALSKRNHPFKYATLSTVDDDLMPQSRTVVLREVSESLNCIIFTDKRTAKVRQLVNNANACLLAYHSKKLLQVKLNGRLIPVIDPVETKRLFQKVSEKAIKDYTTVLSPATAISNPDQVDYVSRQQNHFLALEFIPLSMECLQLKRPNHLRALFKKDNDDWKGQWLVP